MLTRNEPVLKISCLMTICFHIFKWYIGSLFYIGIYYAPLFIISHHVFFLDNLLLKIYMVLHTNNSYYLYVLEQCHFIISYDFWACHVYYMLYSWNFLCAYYISILWYSFILVFLSCLSIWWLQIFGFSALFLFSSYP